MNMSEITDYLKEITYLYQRLVLVSDLTLVKISMTNRPAWQEFSLTNRPAWQEFGLTNRTAW